MTGEPLPPGLEGGRPARRRHTWGRFRLVRCGYEHGRTGCAISGSEGRARVCVVSHPGVGHPRPRRLCGSRPVLAFPSGRGVLRGHVGARGPLRRSTTQPAIGVVARSSPSSAGCRFVPLLVARRRVWPVARREGDVRASVCVARWMGEAVVGLSSAWGAGFVDHRDRFAVSESRRETASRSPTKRATEGRRPFRAGTRGDRRRRRRLIRSNCLRRAAIVSQRGEGWLTYEGWWCIVERRGGTRQHGGRSDQWRRDSSGGTSTPSMRRDV